LFAPGFGEGPKFAFGKGLKFASDAFRAPAGIDTRVICRNMTASRCAPVARSAHGNAVRRSRTGHAKSATAPATVGGELSSTMPLGCPAREGGTRASTRKSGDRPGLSSIRCAVRAPGRLSLRWRRTGSQMERSPA
jgi:hypothetical protein